MKIIFGYYVDKDFGLIPYPDYLLAAADKGLEDSISSEGSALLEEYVREEERIGEYIKFLITGIMEDFQYKDMLEDFLPELEKLEKNQIRKLEWDGQAFQYTIKANKVTMIHTIFGECNEYPKWSCKFSEFKKVLSAWNKFLGLPVSLESRIEVLI